MNYKDFLKYFPDHCIQIFDDNKTGGPDKSKAKTIAGDKVVWEQMEQVNQKGSGVFFSVNQFPKGIRKIESCQGINAWFAESDDLTLNEQYDNLSDLKLRPSFVVKSKSSLHAYWLAKDGSMENFKLIQEWLKRRLSGCNAMVDYTRVLRIPEFDHMKDPNDPVKVELMDDNHQLVYTEQQMLDEFVDFEQVKKEEQAIVDKLKEVEAQREKGGNDVYDAINNIPIELVVSRVMAWEWDGKKHWYAKGSKAPSACYKASDGNYVMHGGTQHFTDTHNGYSPFDFVKMVYSFDNNETFEWFKDNYPDISEISRKEKEAWKENKKVEGKELIAKSIKKEKELDFKQYFIKEKDEKGKTIPAQIAKGRQLIAEYLLKKYNCLSINTGNGTRLIYRYHEGVYSEETDFIKSEVQRLLDEFNNLGNISEILEKIKNLNTVKREIFEDIDKNLINLNNGILNIATKEIIVHSPEYYFFNKLPVDYKPEVECKLSMQVFNDVLAPEDMNILQEWFGFCLYRQYFIKKALILTGDKNTGKTTILNILSLLIGGNNISGISLHELGTDRFASSDLYTMYLNIYDELSPDDINNTGKFKMVTGGSPIKGQIKHGGRFPFVNYSKLLFACNRIPAVNDVDDDAYFDRWIIINFNKPIKNKNPFILEKLNTEEERSGLLNFALEGLYRLLVEKEFSYDKTPEEIKQEMLRYSNSIASFVYNCLIDISDSDDSEYISRDILFDAYRDYCVNNKLVVETRELYDKRIQKYAPYLRDYKMSTAEGARLNCFKNVKLLDHKT